MVKLKIVSYSAILGIGTVFVHSLYGFLFFAIGLQQVAALPQAPVWDIQRQLLAEGKGVHPGENFGLTWGAEKEGSTAILTRVASPSGATLRDFMETLSSVNKTLFLRDFFTHYREGGDYNARGEVRDVHGDVKNIPWEKIDLEDVGKAPLDILKETWEAWIVMTEGSPFSFIHPEVRRKIFNGTLPGLKDEDFKNRRFHFDKPWKPIFGRAQNYIKGVYKDGKSWEIHFKPQKSYGEFEEMIRWFREELKVGDRLFHQPGHQRIVFPRASEFNGEKVTELFKVLQALIATSEMEKGEAIRHVFWKSVHADVGNWEERGVLRVEPQRWGEGFYGVEFRAGMRNETLRRFVLTVTASRVIGDHWGDLEDASSWELIRPWFEDLHNLGDRFESVDRETVGRARYHWERYMPEFRHLYYAPLWNWEDAPFLSREKKERLWELSRDFVRNSADTSIGREDMLRLAARWVERSDITTDLKLYASPRERGCNRLVGEIL